MNNIILKEDVQHFAANFELAEKLKGKTFLITGTTGLIGSVLIKCLLALNEYRNLGLKIIAVIRNEEKAKSVFEDEYSQIDFRQLELSEINKESISDSVDYIIHLASPTASKFFVEYPVETLRTAIEGTTAILEYAKSVAISGFVYASSLETYGRNLTDDLLDENFQGYVNPLEVRSSYNIGKRACECLCHSYANEYKVPVMIARMTQTFGAGVEYNDGRVFAQFARKVIEGKDIELHTKGDTCRMYCYTTDAIRAMLFILLKGNVGEAYNVANKDSYISIREMANMVREHFNRNINVVLKFQENQGYAPETKLKLDVHALESLGWQPNYSLVNMFDRLICSLK